MYCWVLRLWILFVYCVWISALGFSCVYGNAFDCFGKAWFVILFVEFGCSCLFAAMLLSCLWLLYGLTWICAVSVVGWVAIARCVCCRLHVVGLLWLVCLLFDVDSILLWMCLSFVGFGLDCFWVWGVYVIVGVLSFLVVCWTLLPVMVGRFDSVLIWYMV